MSLYIVNLRRNVFAAISVSVGILLFLFASLIIDFNYSTYVNGTARVQDNYIAIRCNSIKSYNELNPLFENMKTIVFGHANATGVLYSNDGLKIPVTYNIIITNNVVENLYFYSWQDQYGNDDLSNSFNFEKLEIISGNNTFYSQNEVIISEGLSRALEGKNSKLLLGVDGTQGAYNVVGVYKTFLSEDRINKTLYSALKDNIDPSEAFKDDSLVYPIIMPEKSISDKAIDERYIYVFFDNEKGRTSIIAELEKIESSGRIANQFSYISPQLIEVDNREEWLNSLQTKTILMLLISVISGISIMGTMVNSVAERKKEIGIKKALGASDADIMGGFLLENIINSLLAIIISVSMTSIMFLGYI